MQLRLELESLRYSISHHLNAHHGQIAEKVKEALESYLSEEHIVQRIDAAIEKTVPQIIHEEVDDFFRNGGGRDAIKSSLQAALSSGITSKG